MELMEKLTIKTFALGACLSSGLAATAAQVPERSNMVLIIADDCSYYDLGCYGAVNNRTPNIDAVFDRMKLKLPPQFVDTEVTREYYARYLAEIGLLDKEVGDVVSLLDEKGLRRNTLVVFVSEQGTLFAGAKWINWSAGVKAGMLASWPGVIEEGAETQAIVQYGDILPTFIELAGGTRPAVVDGRSLLQVMKGKARTHHKYAYHVHNNVPEGPPYPIRSISDGHYRLIWNLTPDSTYIEKHILKNEWYKSWTAAGTERAKRLLNRFAHRPEYELYDIEEDPFEMNNLVGKKKYAEKQRELLAALKDWMKSQHDPGAKADKPRKSKTAQKNTVKKSI